MKGCFGILVWVVTAIIGTLGVAQATCPVSAPTSLVYGYTVTYGSCTTTFKTLEAAELYLRGLSTSYDGATLGFPVLPNSAAHALYAPLIVSSSNILVANQYQTSYLDYRQAGYLGTANGGNQVVYPFSILQTGYALYDWHWPPAQMAAACVSPQNYACAGSPYLPGFCATTQQELSRAQCQFQHTWNLNPSYCWNLSGTPALHGSLALTPNHILPGSFTDPNGTTRKTAIAVVRSGSSTDISGMYVDFPAQSCGSTGGATVQLDTDARVASTTSTLDVNISVQQQQAVSCPAGTQPTATGQSATTGCATSPLKSAIKPSDIKQAKGPCVGDPCYPGNGNSTVTEMGFSYGEITFNLYYNSLRELRPYAWIDQNWSATFAQRLLTSALTNTHDDTASVMLLQSDDALLEQFASVSSTLYRSTNEMGRTITVNGGSPTTYTLRDTNGDMQIFDVYGRIVQLSTPDNPRKTLTITYMPSYTDPVDTRFWHVSKVQDGSGRSINFSYDTAAPNYRLLSISADNNAALIAFSYDSLERLSSTIRPDVNNGSLIATRTYKYDESAHITSGTDLPYHLTGILDEKNQRYFTAEYDDWGRVKASWLGTGLYQHVSLAYTDSATLGAGNPPAITAYQSYVTVTTPLGSTVTYDYTGGRPYRKPDTISVSGQGLEQLNYDANGQVTSKIDRRNVETDYEYSDGIHQTAIVEDATGTTTKRRTETDWDTSNRVKARRIFDASHNLLTETRLVYGANGQVTARCQYDPVASGYVCGSATNAPAGVRQWTYSYCTAAISGFCPAAGYLLSVNGPRLTTDSGMNLSDDKTNYTYYTDSPNTSGCGTFVGPCYRLGDLKQVTDVLGYLTKYLTYDAWGHPVRILDRNNVYTDLTYSQRGWLLTRTVRANADGTPNASLDATTVFAYDNIGNISQVTQPDGSFLAYQYDDAHRLTSVSDNLGNSITYVLDAEGNRKDEKRADPGSNLWYEMKRSYDQLNHLYQLVNGNNTVLQTYPSSDGYDANGNALHSVDAYNVQTQSAYDPLNRLIDTYQDYQGTSGSTANANTHYTYDVRNNLVGVRDPDNLTTSYTYDALNNLSQLQSPDTGTTTYGYDGAGNRTSQTDARGINTTFVYDVGNRLKVIQYPTSTLNVTYTYDATASGCYNAGRMTKMFDSSGTTTYCYDLRGNIVQKTQVTKNITLVTSYTYTVADRLASVTYPSGMKATYARDTRGLITGVTYTPAGSQTATTLVSNIAYYAFGPLNQITFGNGRTLRKGLHTDGSNYFVFSSAPEGLQIWYGVDILGNIRNASTSSDLNPPTRTYGLDNLYRMTEVDQGTTVLEKYTYNKTGDRLSSLAGAYNYAPSTHRLSNDPSSNYSYDNAGNPISVSYLGTNISMNYDARNRLAGGSAFGGIYASTYNYDGKGERVSKVANYNGNQNSLFVYNESGALIGEYSSTGSVINEFIYADALPVAVTQSSGNAYYLETDHLGTPRVAVDPVRNVAVWKWDFYGSGFGTNMPLQDPDGDGTQFVLNLRYPGQYYDAEQGFHYNYFRDYNPKSGRYLESDPLGMKAGADLYQYVKASPIMYMDRLGLKPCDHNGETYCDGRGNLTFYNCSPSKCVQKCTRKHEEQHVRDFEKRYGPGGCQGVPEGQIPDDSRFNTAFGPSSYGDFRNFSECSALKESVKCALALRSGGKAGGCGCEDDSDLERYFQSKTTEFSNRDCWLKYGFHW